MTPQEILQLAPKLSTVPAVVSELLEAFKREETNAEKLARILMADQGLSAKTLRLANSAYYRKSREISSIRDAVVLLGADTLRTLVVSTALAGNIPAPLGFDRMLFWRYSLHTAGAARHLARHAAVDPDLAFAVGLMHAVGEPLVWQALPKESASLDRRVAFYHTRQRAAAEREALGTDHAQVGALLAERWSFPTAMVEGIRLTADPLEVEPFPALAGVARLAADVAAAHEAAEDDDAVVKGLDAALLKKLGLKADPIREMLPVPQLVEDLTWLVQ
ncbi:MAG: HDOD domain-containing protein [Gammaproteobacteria bacterium]|nr:HDOD domain-containing protein [Gammaproteobacteria bacterium]